MKPLAPKTALLLICGALLIAAVVSSAPSEVTRGKATAHPYSKNEALVILEANRKAIGDLETKLYDIKTQLSLYKNGENPLEQNSRSTRVFDNLEMSVNYPKLEPGAMGRSSFTGIENSTGSRTPLVVVAPAARQASFDSAHEQVTAQVDPDLQKNVESIKKEKLNSLKNRIRKLEAKKVFYEKDLKNLA